MYAIIRTASFYNQARDTILVDGFSATKAKAEALAARAEAASREYYGCQELGHNQASGWAWEIRRVNTSRRTYRGEYIPDFSRT